MQSMLTSPLVAAVGLIPQSTPRATDVPVREVVDDELLEFAPRLVEVPRFEVLVISICHRVRLRQHPAVEWAALSHSDVARLVVGIETIHRRVVGVEAVDVPKCEEHLGVGLSDSIGVEVGWRPRRTLRSHVPAD